MSFRQPFEQWLYGARPGGVAQIHARGFHLYLGSDLRGYFYGYNGVLAEELVEMSEQVKSRESST